MSFRGWRDWATKKKEQDRKARMEALEVKYHRDEVWCGVCVCDK